MKKILGKGLHDTGHLCLCSIYPFIPFRPYLPSPLPFFPALKLSSLQGMLGVAKNTFFIKWQLSPLPLHTSNSYLYGNSVTLHSTYPHITGRIYLITITHIIPFLRCLPLPLPFSPALFCAETVFLTIKVRGGSFDWISK